MQNVRAYPMKVQIPFIRLIIIIKNHCWLSSESNKKIDNF